MLATLGIMGIKLLTYNPAKLTSLAEAGVEVVIRVPLLVPINRENRAYLAAKATRAGRSIDGLIEALATKERASGDGSMVAELRNRFPPAASFETPSSPEMRDDSSARGGSTRSSGGEHA